MLSSITYTLYNVLSFFELPISPTPASLAISFNSLVVLGESERCYLVVVGRKEWSGSFFCLFCKDHQLLSSLWEIFVSLHSSSCE